MKRIQHITIAFSTLLLSTGMSYHTKAQSSAQHEGIKTELDRLMTSKEPSDRQILDSRLKMLAASNTEAEMAIAGSYYFRLKNTRAADSVLSAEAIKFPKGLQARIKTQQAISQINNLPELEKAYLQFIRDFPPGNYTSLPFGEDKFPYDRLRSKIATQYAKKKNVAKAGLYASQMQAEFWKVRSYGDISAAFYANGDLDHAALYQKKAMESAAPFAGGKLGNSPAASFAERGYPEACRMYAQILYGQQENTEALKYIEIATKSAKEPSADFYYTYAKILSELNRNNEAYTQIELAVRSGEATKEMADLFQELYKNVKGSDKGLDAYQADIRKGVMDNLHKHLSKNILNEPAANFTLTDLQGKQVDLAALKGKIVILDFWATWCVPCKASFPAMQMAVDKYKNDPGIRFLFIHTWERTNTAREDARAYIASMKYDFEVLMDTKDSTTKANKVVDAYGVTSIPAKFVIDQDGNIRFKLTGFNGSKEAAVDEISMMVDMVRGK